MIEQNQIDAGIGVFLSNVNSRSKISNHNGSIQEPNFTNVINTIGSAVGFQSVTGGARVDNNVQKSIIANIARQCPLKGGSVVHWARNIEVLYQIKRYDDEEICYGRSSSRIGDNNTKRKIKVHPNPTSGEFDIEFDIALEEDAEFLLYDMNGRVVYQQQLAKAKFNYHVSTRNLDAGIYIGKIYSGEKSLFRTKVVITNP